MEQHLAKANEDTQAAEVEPDSLRRDKERLTAKVKILEREVQWANRGRAHGPTAIKGGGREPDSREGGGLGGAPNTLAPGSSWPGRMRGWHAQAKQMSAVATGLCMALLQNQMDVEVGTVAPELGRVAQAHEQLVQQYPPHRLTAALLDANFGGGGAELPGLRRPEVCRRGGGCSPTLDLVTCCPI